MDVNYKSDRVEWGHARYQSLYRCDQAYEIIAQWVAASGSVVADLVCIEYNIYTFLINYYIFLFFRFITGPVKHKLVDFN